MIRRLMRYLIPPPTRRETLPLLPSEYSKPAARLALEPELRRQVDLLKGHAVAKTDYAALRLLQKHAGESVGEIILKHKRQRRRRPKWQVALEKFIALW